MLTTFGIWLLLGIFAFSLFLSTTLFYDNLKANFKEYVGIWLGLTTIVFLAWLFVTNFLCGTNVPVQETNWRTIHPNEKKVTVAVKSNCSNYVTVTSKTKRTDIEYTKKIKLTQGNFVKEKDIENVIVDGDGPILDKVQYGTETTQYAIFGKPILKHKGHCSALRFVYKEPSSNKTLDDMLK